MSDLSQSCPECPNVFDTIKGLQTHYGIAHDGNLDNNTCDDCGESFYSEWGTKKYCHDCFSFKGEKNPNYGGGDIGNKERAKCEICDEIFLYYPSSKKGLYCSNCQEKRPWVSKDDAPKSNKKRVNLCCDWCEEPIERRPSCINDHNFCSKSCQYSWLSDYYEGEGHPNWVESYPSQYSNGWWSVKKKALERDKHKCQLCGKTKEEIGREPDVHHIKPVRSFEDQEDAHRTTNVVCLCPGCHRDVEPKDLNSSST